MKRRYAGAFAALAVVLAALGPSASAHTSVAESSPAEGESLPSAPAEAWVRFGSAFLPAQPLAATDARLEVYDPCGKRVDDERSSFDPITARVSVGLSGSAAGRYELHWYATATDGAAQAGVIRFFVTSGQACKTVVRSDPQGDTDGIDVLSVAAGRARRAANVRIALAERPSCESLSSEDGDEVVLSFDTNSDGSADVEGSLECLGPGRYAVIVDNDGGQKGRLRATFEGATLVVVVGHQALVPHLEVAVRTVAGSSCGEGEVCTDLAPDLGSVRVY